MLGIVSTNARVMSEKFNFTTEYQILLRKGARPNLVLETYLKAINVQISDKNTDKTTDKHQRS